ncbi:MAG TPA: NADH-quinone oxidoreductase subunit L [Symbiobacteriaceae bacterium]|nr:NADH-quinone oxidoreductase subunit L [Symbiobacteriaceae bacterium]
MLLVALILIPLLSAAVVGYFRNTWSKTAISAVASSSVFATFLITLYHFVQYHGEPFTAPLTTWGELGRLLPEFGLKLDALSLWWMIVVTGCGFLIHVYATAYMRDDASFGRFMAKMNFFIYAMSLLVLADNFVGLLMGWGNVGLASYMLIGFYITKPSASNAAIKAFVMNLIGEAGMIAGIAFAFKTFGYLKFDDVFEMAHLAPWTVNTICILLLVGAVAKSAQFPLHTWLPYAMEGPTPVSALIHAATMVTAGVYLVSRLWPLYHVAPTAGLWVAWVGGIGALMGALIAAGQNDIKRVLAFSTMSQIGYMFLGNGLGAYVAADFHFFTHAFFKACLFLTAGIVVHHYAGDQDIRKMGGMWNKDRFASVIFLIGTLALIGVPGFAGFFSKDEILLAAKEHNMALFVVGVLAAGVTTFYNVRLFSLVFLGKPYEEEVKQVGKKKSHAAAAAHGHGHDAHGQGHDDHHHATPAAQKWPVAILAVLSVVSGWVALIGWPAHFLAPVFEGLEEGHAGFHIDPVVFGAVIAMMLIGGGLSWYLYGPNGVRREAERDLHAPAGPLVSMLYFDAIYDFLIVSPMKAIADFCANIGDAKIIDGIVNGLGTVSVSIGSGLRELNNGYIRRYALTVFTGVALMLAYFIFYV